VGPPLRQTVRTDAGLFGEESTRSTREAPVRIGIASFLTFHVHVGMAGLRHWPTRRRRLHTCALPASFLAAQKPSGQEIQIASSGQGNNHPRTHTCNSPARRLEAGKGIRSLQLSVGRIG
jgi:hypothetical protein